MQGRVARVALTFAITAWALIFSGCGTTGGRISQHPEMYQSLSPRDQALVSQGQIRAGMTMDAVWLAWGTPDQRFLTTWTVALLKRGSIYATKHLPATADRTIMGHSTGRISLQSSCTRPEASPSPTAELCFSDTSLHRNWSLACQLSGRHDLLAA